MNQRPDNLRGEHHRLPVGSLLHHPDNPNEGDTGAIAESISQHGVYKPIIVHKGTRHILAGNHTYDALGQLGYTEVDCWVVDCTDEEALDILLTDNHIASLAVVNEGKLSSLLQGIHDRRGSLEGTSFDGDDLDDMLRFLSRPMIAAEISEEPYDAPDTQRKETDNSLRAEEGREAEDEVECPSCGHRFAP
jgi:ParB-like chromosome segregation protein Spo0J